MTLNAGLRYEFTTMPEEKYNRDSALPDLTASAPVVGPLYENPTYTNLSPRAGRWRGTSFGDGRTAVRGGYGLYFNTNNQQNLIVTVTNPPFTPRPVIANPTFPNPPFDRASAISMRPVQWDLDNPRVHIWNVNVQQELWGRTAVTIGYAGSRGRHLLRSGDVNLAQPTGTTADGRPFIAAGTPRINTGVLDHRAEEQRRRLVVQRAHLRGPPPLEPGPVAAVVLHVLEERGHDTGLDVLLRRDQRHHVGVARVHPRLQPRTVGLRHPPQLGAELHRGAARARGLTGVAGAILGGWNVSGIWTMRSGNPLTVFVTTNRSRSQWNPSRGPGIGQDRPDYAPGYGPDNAVLGRPEQWFDPAAFVLQPAGTFGNTGRGDFTGPNLRTLDIGARRSRSAWARLGGRVEVRLEAFNMLNRANFGVPELRAFSGTEGEPVLATFGRISNTVTSSRQIQLGVRVVF